ncbi:MAG: type II secretion system protein [Erysipelotrichaceae bacterium]
MLNNKGFTLIEMIIILAIVSMLTTVFSIKLSSSNASTKLELIKLKQTIIQSQLNSIYLAKRNNVAIEDSALVINEIKTPLNKLSCSNTEFNYNMNGHINGPVKLECYGNKTLYNFNLSLGTGILYE